MFNSAFRFFILNQKIELFIHLFKFVFLHFLLLLFAHWLSENTKKTPSLLRKLLFFNIAVRLDTTFLNLICFVRIRIILLILFGISINICLRRPAPPFLISFIFLLHKLIIMISHHSNLIYMLWLHFFIQRQHINRKNM